MKKLSKVFVSVATLLLAGQVFANQTQEGCLPTSVVANTTFTKAVQDPNPQQSSIWAMISDNTTYNQKEWNVVFVAVLKNATSQAEALAEGQSYFKSVPVSEPQITVFGDQVFCQYASLDNQYAVISASPPLTVNTSAQLTKKFR